MLEEPRCLSSVKAGAAMAVGSMGVAGRSPGQWPVRNNAGGVCVALRPSLSQSPDW